MGAPAAATSTATALSVKIAVGISLTGALITGGFYVTQPTVRTALFAAHGQPMLKAEPMTSSSVTHPVKPLNRGHIIPTEPGTPQERETKARDLEKKLASLPANSNVRAAYLYKLGSIYYTLGKFEDARDRFAQAISLFPERKNSLIILIGECNEQLDDFAAAEQQYRQICHLNTGDGQIAFSRYGEVAKHDEAAAVRLVETAIAMPDTRLSADQFRGAIQILAELNPDRAKPFYAAWLKAHAQHPDAPVVALDEYQLDHPAGKLKSAELELLCGQYNCDTAAGMHMLFDLASAYMNEGKFTEVIRVYNHLIDLEHRVDTKSPYYSKNLIISVYRQNAFAYEFTGDTAKAKEMAETLIERYPNSPEAKEMKEWLKREIDHAPLDQ